MWFFRLMKRKKNPVFQFKDVYTQKVTPFSKQLLVLIQMFKKSSQKTFRYDSGNCHYFFKNYHKICLVIQFNKQYRLLVE